jgi:hypothetical protein
MQQIGFHKAGEQTVLEEVTNLRPFPVEIPEASASGLPPVAGRSTFAQVTVPGITTGAAYADGDCLGTLMEFPNLLRSGKSSGLLHTALYFDLDDEGLQVDLHLFSRPILSPGADNAAFTPSDSEVLAYLGTLTFTSFFNLGANQVSMLTNVGIALQSSGTSVWGHLVARGALNIAANNLPVLRLAVLPD